MDRAWYIVDDDGNIGFLDCNKNGPVPRHWEQVFVDNLTLGYLEKWPDKFLPFNLTDEQIWSLLDDGHAPSEEISWYGCIVKIDTNRTDEFLAYNKKKGIIVRKRGCISKRLGLYRFYTERCVEWKTNKPKGALKSLLQRGIIQRVYKPKDYVDIFRRYDETGDVSLLDGFPYFLYRQKINPYALPEKVHSPKVPVTIDQIPEKFRYRIQHIPGSFRELETFQIADYAACRVDPVDDLPDNPCGTKYLYDGCLYVLLPTTDGKIRYHLSNILIYNFMGDYFFIERNMDVRITATEDAL